MEICSALKAATRIFHWFEESRPMLAEKFILTLETIISNRSPDGAPRVVSSVPFVPIGDHVFLDRCRVVFDSETEIRDLNDNNE
jgi:hypothetical protein